MNATDRRRQFHAHLDVCEQCREHPFALCPVGAGLLTDSVTCNNPSDYDMTGEVALRAILRKHGDPREGR